MGILNVGARALLANQTALQTTGNNIANVNTPGYSRQQAILAATQGQFTGGGYIGKGVDVVAIEREHSEFLTVQAALAASVEAADVQRSDKLRQLQDIFPGGSNGLGAALSDMLNAMSDVANAPTDLTARSVVITRASETAARFSTAAGRITDLQQAIVDQLDEYGTAINGLARQIAAVNDQISRAKGNGQTPNDLLDQREQYVRELNRYVQTSQIEADDGTLSVFVGASQALVLGTTAAPVSVRQNAFADPGSRVLVVERGNVAVELDESRLVGGEMAGLLRFLNRDMAEARNLLDRIAFSSATVINAQHRLGLDLDGNAGGDLFLPPTIAAGRWSNPASTGNVAVTVDDVTRLAASSYELQFDAGTGVLVTRQPSGETLPLFDYGATNPIIVDGLSFQIVTPGVSGERFLIKPFDNSASAMKSVISSPRGLAVADPVEPRIGIANTGTLAVSSLTANTADPNLTTTVQLTFTGPGTFDVVGTGTGNPVGVTYAPGQPISFNGWTLTLNGIPNAGDTITVDPATQAFVPRNAGNAEALLNLRDMTLFDGAALTDGYASMMSQIGTRVQSAQFSTEVSQVIAAQTERERSAVAGVNLDEEAARLIQFQQSYQAAAKMIQIAQSIFQDLIQGLGV